MINRPRIGLHRVPSLRHACQCLCLLTALALVVGQLHAYAAEAQSMAARMLAAGNATSAPQKPSAFRQMLSGKPTAAPPAKDGTVRLFNTMEFKGPLKSLPQWARVMQEMSKHKAQLSASLPAGGKANTRASWETFRDSIKNDSVKDKLRKVNAHFNKYPYRLDQEVWGQTDYWATPAEFSSKSGDCEDYSITKYYALRELGFSTEDLRIVAVKDRIRGIGHAVLVVYAEGTAWVLDNQTDLVLSHDRYSHYLPQYSVNEKNRWAHVPVK